MALMAMAMIPIAGLIGGAVDVSRLYIVKTRLQHACDAGALAGRKTMGGGTWTQTVNNVANYPQIAAANFFDANISATPYGASSLTRSFSESGGKVSGTASAVVSMTLMQVFGQEQQTITVNCDAEMRLPNTDIMFVLDTTGSMGSIPTGDTQTKIDSLKVAVKCFYEIVAKLDTDASCTTGAPSGGTGNQVQIRFGFVPYATNVNVGRLLPTSYFADSWPYQSRTWASSGTTTQGTPTMTSTSTSWGTPSAWSTKSATAPANNANKCQNNNVMPATATTNGATTTTQLTSTTSQSSQTVTYKTDTAVTQTEYQYNSYSSSSNTCYYDTRTTSGTTTSYYTRTDAIQAMWKYGRIMQNISGLKNGTSWNSSFQLPIGNNGTMKSISWDGCIEERATVAQSTYSPIPSGAKDLDLDLVPTQSDSTTLWGPALPDMIYTPSDSYGNWTYTGSLTDGYAEVSSSYDYSNGSSYECPVQAKKLQTWSDASAFDAYVDQLTPGGNTYHDIGLIWGGRLMSPTGIFASENATTPSGGDIERHMIFMTDGDPCTSVGNYQAYGVAWFDRRQTSSSSAPTDGCTTTGTLTQQVNARVDALCTAIKNKNITLWVVTFGYVDPNTVTRLTACASSSKYFSANNAAQIQSTFKSIADQISQLRLTR